MNHHLLWIRPSFIGRNVKALSLIWLLVISGGCKPRTNSDLAAGAVDRVDQLDRYMGIDQTLSISDLESVRGELETKYGDFFRFCRTSGSKNGVMQEITPLRPTQGETVSNCVYEGLVSFDSKTTSEGLRIFAGYNRPRPAVDILNLKSNQAAKNFSLTPKQSIELSPSCLSAGEQITQVHANADATWLVVAHNNGLCVFQQSTEGYKLAARKSGVNISQVAFDALGANLIAVPKSDFNCRLLYLKLNGDLNQPLKEGASLCPESAAQSTGAGSMQFLSPAPYYLRFHSNVMLALYGRRVVFFAPFRGSVDPNKKVNLDSRPSTFSAESKAKEEENFHVEFGAYGPEQTSVFANGPDDYFVAATNEGEISYWEKFRQCDPAYIVGAGSVTHCSYGRFEKLGATLNLSTVPKMLALGRSQGRTWLKPHPRLQGPVNPRLAALLHDKSGVSYLSLLLHQQRPLFRRIIEIRNVNLEQFDSPTIKLLGPADFSAKTQIDPLDATEQFILVGQGDGSELAIWDFGNVYKAGLLAFEAAAESSRQFASPLPESTSEANKKELEFLGWMKTIGLELKELKAPTASTLERWGAWYNNAKWEDELTHAESSIWIVAFYENENGQRTRMLLDHAGKVKIRKNLTQKAAEVAFEPSEDGKLLKINSAQPPIGFEINMGETIKMMVESEQKRDLSEYKDFGIALLLMKPYEGLAAKTLISNSSYEIACEGIIVSKRSQQVSNVVYCKDEGRGGVTFDVRTVR